MLVIIKDLNSGDCLMTCPILLETIVSVSFCDSEYTTRPAGKPDAEEDFVNVFYTVLYYVSLLLM